MTGLYIIPKIVLVMSGQGADLAKPLPTSPHALAHVPEYLRRLLRPAEVARCLSEEGILIRERGAHE